MSWTPGRPPSYRLQAAVGCGVRTTNSSCELRGCQHSLASKMANFRVSHGNRRCSWQRGSRSFTFHFLSIVSFWAVACHAQKFESLGSNSSTEVTPPVNVITALRGQLRNKYCNDSNEEVFTARLRVYHVQETYWKEKAKQFQDLTCAKIEVEGGPYDPVLYKDDMAGPGIFAGYVSDGNLIPDYVKTGGILDITGSVQSLPELDWFDVMPNGPRQVVAYDNKVYGMPLDGDVIYQVYRKDLLNLHNFSFTKGPQTWNDFVQVAEYFHGRDLNGDGTPDFGVCFSTASNDIGHQMFWAVAAPYLQTKGTSSGMWFDVESFEPTASSPIFLDAMDMWKRLVLLSPYTERGPTDWQTAQRDMDEGRCALYINYPGPTKQLISSQNATGLDGGKLQVARLPGVECEKLQQVHGSIDVGASATCPFSTDGINFAPFYAGGGQCATIRLGDPTDPIQRKLHQIMFDLFAYVADPEVSYWDVANPTSLLDPYRTSHVEPLKNPTSKETLAFEYFGWEKSQLDSLREETIFVFNHENGAKDLAIAPFSYQHEATLPYLIDFVNGEASAKDTQSNIVQAWKAVTQQFTLQEQRDEYRKYLGLGSYEESLFNKQELNQLGSSRWIGLSMAASVMLLSTGFAIWVWKKGQSRIVRVSQPPFLYMICCGTFIMGSSIIPLSIDDEIVGQEGCNVSCIAFPWLLSLGFVTTFSALYSKIWRIHKVLKNASRLRRIKVSERDVLIPFLTLFSVNTVLLAIWTGLAPLTWERKQVSPMESYGRCALSGPGSAVFVGLILGILFLSLVLALRQAYQARAISDEFSESAYIGIGVVGWFQVFVVGVPLVFLVDEKATAAFVVKSSMIFVVCASILCLVFVPKIALVASDRDGGRDKFQARLSAFSLQREDVPSTFAVQSWAGERRDAHDSDGMRIVALPQHPSVTSLRKENERLKKHVEILQRLLEENDVSIPSLGDQSAEGTLAEIVESASDSAEETGDN